MRLIDADALYIHLSNRKMKEVYPDYKSFSFDMKRTIGKLGAEFKKELLFAPTIEAEPVRHGKWIVQDETYTRYFCSECKSRNHKGHEKFCPNCGAKMDLE